MHCMTATTFEPGLYGRAIPTIFHHPQIFAAFCDLLLKRFTVAGLVCFSGIMFFWKGSASYLIYFLTLVYAWISINSKRLCRVDGIWRIFVFYYRWIFERLNLLFDHIFHQLPVNFDSVFDWLNSRISYKLKNHHNILSLLQKSVKSTAHFKYYRQIKLNFYNYINNRRFCK